MIKLFKMVYNLGDAEAVFKVDTDKFTKDKAQCTLDFFIWDYDNTENPIDEVIKKYALECIKIATYKDFNTYGVKSEFEDIEGFCKLDGSQGIELLSVEGYSFEEDDLQTDITYLE